MPCKAQQAVSCLLVLCERKRAKTENVQTDAGDNERAAAAGQRGPIAGGSMKRKPHVDGYYSSDGREAQRARPVLVPDDGGWPGRGEPRGLSLIHISEPTRPY